MAGMRLSDASPRTNASCCASSPPALASPGPFSGLVYKNVTVPVYTALKGVRSCCLRWGCSTQEAPCPCSGSSGALGSGFCTHRTLGRELSYHLYVILFLVFIRFLL